MTTAAMTATSLQGPIADAALARLKAANEAFMKAYPGDRTDRQPVHTVYGGAQLFKRDSALRIGALAVAALREYAPNFTVLARAIELRGAKMLPDRPETIRRVTSMLEADPEAVRRTHEPAWLAYAIYQRVAAKLEREAVEDFRIDFEDGYGNRPD
ncbi:MAG: phosphoenolpyruvate kinase, partial [Cyanobacteria bacterium REEB65]|nr:phosphoenolpyruvate kinase [Cyanobacteria bacterium REEB65]